MGLSVEVVNEEGRRLIVAKGEIDLNTSPDLRQAILDGVKSGQPLSVDLSEVAYMDSSGVATLVEGLKSVKGDQQSFTLVRPSDAVRKVLNLARLDTLFEIQDS